MHFEKMPGMDKFFSVFGKVALVLLLIGTVGFGSYYLGQKNKNSGLANITATQNEQISVNIPPEVTGLPTVEPTISTKKINGGVDKKAGLSFSQYSITVPVDCTE